MGAGISQENDATKPNDEELRISASQSSANADAREDQSHSTTKVSSHYNGSKDVMEHGVSPVERSSSKKLNDVTKHASSPVERSSSKKQQLEQDQNTKKNPMVQNSGLQTEPKSVSLSARNLSITWGDDNRYWHWPLLKDSSGESITAAELLNVCWLEVHGKFNTTQLQTGTFYEVVFVVKLKDPAYGWEVPVNVRLNLPCGRKQEHKEILMEKPREKWIEIPAGVFETTFENIGEIEFSLYEYEGGKWKKGLLIKGVSIKPTGPLV